jgi:hypothetical protein
LEKYRYALKVITKNSFKIVCIEKHSEYMGSDPELFATLVGSGSKIKEKSDSEKKNVWFHNTALEVFRIPRPIALTN